MSRWQSVKAKRLLAALLRIGWTVAWPNYTFAFHDSDEIGPAPLAQIPKKTGLRPADL